MEQGAVGYERDIRPLFREKDVLGHLELEASLAVNRSSKSKTYRN